MCLLSLVRYCISPGELYCDEIPKSIQLHSLNVHFHVVQMKEIFFDFNLVVISNETAVTRSHCFFNFISENENKTKRQSIITNQVVLSPTMPSIHIWIIANKIWICLNISRMNKMIIILQSHNIIISFNPIEASCKEVFLEWRVCRAESILLIQTISTGMLANAKMMTINDNVWFRALLIKCNVQRSSLLLLLLFYEVNKKNEKSISCRHSI